MRHAIVCWKYFVVWTFLGRQFFQQFFYGRESLCIAKEQLPTDIHFIWRRVSASLRIKISWNRIKDYRTFNNYVLLGDNALSPNECQGMSKKRLPTKNVLSSILPFFPPLSGPLPPLFPHLYTQLHAIHILQFLWLTLISLWDSMGHKQKTEEYVFKLFAYTVLL